MPQEDEICRRPGFQKRGHFLFYPETILPAERLPDAPVFRPSRSRSKLSKFFPEAGWTLEAFAQCSFRASVYIRVPEAPAEKSGGPIVRESLSGLLFKIFPDCRKMKSFSNSVSAPDHLFFHTAISFQSQADYHTDSGLHQELAYQLHAGYCCFPAIVPVRQRMQR